MSEFLGTRTEETIICDEAYDKKTRKKVIKYLTNKCLPPKELALLKNRKKVVL